MDNLLDQLTALADEAARSLGCELVDLEINRGKNIWTVRVYLDKPANDAQGRSGVTIQECGSVSNMLSGLLEVNDPIAAPYHLEVSSPGALRPLKKMEDFQRFVGRMAAVYLSVPPDPIDGRRRFLGRILGVEGEAVILSVDGVTTSFAWETVSRAHLELDMPGKGQKIVKQKGGQAAPKKR